MAEGVESDEQAGLMRWMGCDVGQGWLYGRTMPSEQLSNFLDELYGAPGRV